MKANAKVTNAIRNIIGAAYGDTSLDYIKNALLDTEPPYTRDFSRELGGISCIL